MGKVEYNKFHKAMIKRVAQNVAQYVAKKNSLIKEVEALQKQITHLQNMIASSEAPVRELTGYGVEDLVRKVTYPTDKLDKNGKVVKITKFELIYPETVVPPTPENTENVENVEENTEINESENNDEVEVLDATTEESVNNDVEY